MSVVDRYHNDGWPGGLPGTTTRLFIAIVQFILAITVCGLYGQDLNAARKAHVYMDANWVYAVCVGGVSGAIALIYMIPRTPWRYLFPADLLAFVSYVALFGVFGSKYINEDPENVGHGDGPKIQRMKNAVWIDLTNMLLWLVTSAWGVFSFFRIRHSRTLHTGRAEL